MPYGVTNTIFRADWLRGVDQGIGADFLGNLFCLIMEKLLGTKERKSNALWLGIQRDYYIHEVQDKLPTVSNNSVRPSLRQAPKLRGCSAVACRSLILFGHLAAQRHLSDDVPKVAATKAAAHHL